MTDILSSEELMHLPPEEFGRLVLPWFFSRFCPKNEFLECKVRDGIEINLDAYDGDAALDAATIIHDHLGVPKDHPNSLSLVRELEAKSLEWSKVHFMKVGDPFAENVASERHDLERKIKDQCRQVLDCVAEIRFLMSPPQGSDQFPLPAQVEEAVDGLSRSATSLILTDSLLGQSGYLNTAKQTPAIEQNTGTLSTWIKKKADGSAEAFFKALGTALGVGVATGVGAAFASLILKSERLLELIAKLW